MVSEYTEIKRERKKMSIWWTFIDDDDDRSSSILFSEKTERISTLRLDFLDFCCCCFVSKKKKLSEQTKSIIQSTKKSY